MVETPEPQTLKEFLDAWMDAPENKSRIEAFPANFDELYDELCMALYRFGLSRRR